MDARIDQLEARNGQLESEKTDLEARIEELEEENIELTIDQLEKIPKCPVTIKLHFTLSDKFPQCLIFRFVLSSSRRASTSSAAWLDITSVDPARPRRQSR